MSVIDDLAAATSAPVLTTAQDCARYVTDWTGRWTGRALAVVRPRDADEAGAVLRICSAVGQAVIPQGGNTGLVGGTVPIGAAADAVIVSTELMRAVGDVTEAGHVTVGAGVTLTELGELAADAGWAAGLTLASGGSATVGGAVATNAGGARVLRYGSARARVAGLRAVLASGEIVDRTTQLTKDNTGYDLMSGLAGSEGTLALITDVTWRLVPAQRARLVVVLAFPDVRSAVRSLPLMRALPGLGALEWVRGEDISRVCAHLDRRAPLPTDGCWVFADLTGTGEGDLLADAADQIEALTDVVSADRIAVGASATEARSLWDLRERMTEAINTLGVPIKLDVGVPLEAFADFLDRVAAALDDVDPVLFGHLAEGNTHVNVLPSMPGQSWAEDVATDVEERVLAIVLDVGGTISAEHGIGRAKSPWLSRQRTSTEISLMRAVKAAWDPAGIMNPGVLFGDKS